ncbi:hypothetical protein AOA14_08665 [Sphingopyxis terrae subsp. terrae NBRC 15098]|uniref:HEPN AbiU2-like domain-containing protein n=1 Tax=Sphingopyxis terrae subsp. terrae NBRC 15098 TaxID=1219058 RepID=A0A142VY55_9SPHN|nr:hypothetical protein [Sphingopyxis terrae]AMU94671.1 hypothetical protein AOA14_08665 [Sphingopyxis terrae subsp. terrae NBRC 15098]
MKDKIQANYEERLSRYVSLVQGTEPPGLVPKLAVYRELLRQHAIHGDRLWKIEPVLHPLIFSAETDLHLATARLLEEPRRAAGSLFAFLDFCITNRANITWKSGQPTVEILEGQLNALESRRKTINAIMGRRDKFFAHLDKRYFKEPARIYADYPLEADDVIALVNAVIGVVTEHQWKLKESAAIGVAEFYAISVDNMVRNLEAGRRRNFPGQLD